MIIDINLCVRYNIHAHEHQLGTQWSAWHVPPNHVEP